ncbi:hypothetical protein GCM10009426_20060 [Rheinheimera tangshanensis]|nr:hypothetical protein GCM10010920_28310 [Rheinheimera tangshanensis]
MLLPLCIGFGQVLNLLGQDKLLQANLARDNDQRGKDQEEHVLLWPIIPGLCQFLCG